MHHWTGSSEACCQWLVLNHINMHITALVFTFTVTEVRLSFGNRNWYDSEF